MCLEAKYHLTASAQSNATPRWSSLFPSIQQYPTLMHISIVHRRSQKEEQYVWQYLPLSIKRFMKVNQSDVGLNTLRTTTSRVDRSKLWKITFRIQLSGVLKTPNFMGVVFNMSYCQMPNFGRETCVMGQMIWEEWWRQCENDFPNVLCREESSIKGSVWLNRNFSRDSLAQDFLITSTSPYFWYKHLRPVCGHLNGYSPLHKDLVLENHSISKQWKLLEIQDYCVAS